MRFEGMVKCETCGTYNHILKHNDLELNLNESNILEWKCDNCGLVKMKNKILILNITK